MKCYLYTHNTNFIKKVMFSAVSVDDIDLMLLFWALLKGY